MRSLKKWRKIGFQDWLSLNAGQKYCRMLQESILQYFQPALSYYLSLRPLFCLFLVAAHDRFYCVLKFWTLFTFCSQIECGHQGWNLLNDCQNNKQERHWSDMLSTSLTQEDSCTKIIICATRSWFGLLYNWPNKQWITTQQFTARADLFLNWKQPLKYLVCTFRNIY